MRAETLDKALAEAAEAAARDPHREPVVLLSPACASFDQFIDFEARGDAFRDLVQGMTRRDGKSKALEMRREPQAVRR